jgi:hypothetical protein
MYFEPVFGSHNLLVLQDGHSKWPEVKILPRTDASLLIEALRTLFTAYWLPEVVTTYSLLFLNS